LTREELLELIAEVQQHQSELDDVEVKSPRDGGGNSQWTDLGKIDKKIEDRIILEINHHTWGERRCLLHM
jgi:hypothetical protein